MPEEAVVPEDYFIEDYLIKSLGTPQFLQFLLGSSRVRIKNNAATNVFRWEIAYSFLWIVLVTVSCLVIHEFYYKEFFCRDMLLGFSSILTHWMQYASVVLSMLTNRFSQRENNVKIYGMLQKVDKIFGLENCTYYSNFQYRANVAATSAMFVGFMTGFAANAILLADQSPYTSFYAFGLFAMYMDILLGMCMIYFLAVRTKIFNTMLKNLIQEYKGTEKKPKALTLKRYLYSMAVPTIQKSNTKLPREKWIEFLQQILKSYKMITSLFNFSVFNLSLTVLIWTFPVISADVVGQRSGIFPLHVQIMVALWAGFYYLLLIVFAVVNDWFTLEVKKMKLLCIRLISYDYDGPYQKTASEMINFIHYDTPIYKVYGIFVLEKRLPLEIIAVIASNSLVLVQFLIEQYLPNS